MNENQNPVASDLGSVPTDMPLLKEGTYDLKCTESTLAPNMEQKAPGANKTWKLSLQTLDVGESPQGDIVPAGKTIFHNVGLLLVGKQTQRGIEANVGGVVQGMGMTNFSQYGASAKEQIENIGAWHGLTVGQTVRAKVVIEPESKNAETGKTYPAKNSVKLFLKKGQ